MPTTMKMEHNDHPILAGISVLLCICSGIFNLLTWNDVQPIMTIISVGIAAVTSTFAVRYYWFATKKVINENKRNNETKKPEP